MLTNLDWLGSGKPYPPTGEQARIERYRENRKLFETDHAEEWREEFDRIARRLRKSPNEVRTILNYQQLLSKKTADFVCSEPPTLEFKGDADGIGKLLEQQRFSTKLYEGIIDVSRYGNAIQKIVDNRLSTVAPEYWFPIVSPADLKEIVQHVIAFPTDFNDRGEATELYVEIHNAGSVETRRYSYSGQTKLIGELKENGDVVKTNLDGFAVFPLFNVTHSGNIYGLDDYTIVNSLVKQIMWRLHCADNVLDKHSEPSMTGPASALDFDERTGMYYLNLGNYFKRNSNDDPNISYVTWDGNLTANLAEIDVLFNQLYILSEMGAAFLEGNSSGSTNSGTALKLRLVAPRIKAQRIVGINDATVRDIIAALCRVNSMAVDPDKLNLVWNDGLPDDPVEDANRRAVETGGRPTKSQFAAIKERGLSDEETEAELEQIRLEQAASAPYPLGIKDPFSGEDVSDNDGTNSGELIS